MYTQKLKTQEDKICHIFTKQKEPVQHRLSQAIPKLVEGLTVAQVEEKIGGIKCGFKNTSCGDQLAKACREAYEAQK